MMTEIYTKLMSRMVYLKSKKGQTLVEYGLILALVSIVVIAVLTTLGTKIQNIFTTISTSLNSAS